MAQVSTHMPVHFILSSDLLTTHPFLSYFYLHSYLHHEKKEASFDEVLLGKDRLCYKLMEELASSFNRLKSSQRQYGEYVEKQDAEKHQVKKKANKQDEAAKAQCVKKLSTVESASFGQHRPNQ